MTHFHTRSSKRLVPIEVHISGDNRVQIAYTTKAHATELFLSGAITVRQLPSGEVVYSAKSVGALRGEASR